MFFPHNVLDSKQDWLSKEKVFFLTGYSIIMQKLRKKININFEHDKQTLNPQGQEHFIYGLDISSGVSTNTTL